LALCAGTLELVHTRTRRRSRHAYAAVQLGSLEVLGAVRPATADGGAAGGDGGDARDVAELVDAVEQGVRLTTVLGILTERFGPVEFGLEQALPEAADQIVADAAAALEARFESTYEQLYEVAEPDLAALTTAGYRLPPSLRLPAEQALGRRLEAEILAQGGSWDRTAYEAALSLVDEAQRHGLRIDMPRARRALEQSLTAAVVRATEGDPEALDAAMGLLGLADALGVHLALDRAQELVYEAILAAGPDPGAVGPLRRLGQAIGLSPGPLGIPPAH
jgi:hypothetical protein